MSSAWLDAWPNLEAFTSSLGAWGYVFFGVAALLEYVFPPFPGDTVTVFGGVWAARDGRSVPLVYVGLMAGSVVGIVATWLLGFTFAHRLNALPESARVFGVQVSQLRAAQQLMRQRGPLLLLVNRFLPSFRSILFVAAGASEVPLGKCLGWGVLSAALFNGGLVWLGTTLGNNLERIAQVLQSFRWGSLGLLGAVGIVWLGRFLWRRARAQSRP